MYNWIDGRKFSDSKYFPVNLISKNCVPFIRSQYEFSNFRRLPVIKEEDGYVSDDELPQNLLRNSLLKKKYVSQRDPLSNLKNENILKEPKTPMKLPPLSNINCLMNTEIKQTRSIWETKFGKRLISGKNTDEELKSIPKGTKKIRPNSDKSCSEKFGDYQSPKFTSRKKTAQTRNSKNGGGDKEDFTDINTSKKKSKGTNKDKQNSKKNSNKEKEQVKTIQSSNGAKTEKTIDTPSRDLSESSQTVSSFSKSQRFLTECVQSILDGHSDQNLCEHCNENFQNFEELCRHKKQHEAQKEICLLCEKVFYSPNEFIQHLLTHEGVDRFSCKKCKKYFPNLRKYKQHCLDYHFTPPDVTDYQSQSTVEYVKKWLPKYECKRCKIEFDSEKDKEAHRRNHVKKDLAGAYLLSPKYI